MNQLPIAKRVQILTMLCEGVSMRAISRMVDVSINTVTKLLVDAGQVCFAYHNEKVVGVKAKRVQCDEIWSFTYAKQKNVVKAKAAPAGAGDTWTWTALDSDSKLLVSWLVGKRDARHAKMLMDDVKNRLSGRVQITTDGLKAYMDAVEGAFGSDVDYAMLVKVYGSANDGTPYSPGEVVDIRTIPITGDPHPAQISTSHIERQNLTMRMQLRRFTRLTNAFSKKLSHLKAACASHSAWYNFCRIHRTLRVTPAMAAGIAEEIWDLNRLI